MKQEKTAQICSDKKSFTEKCNCHHGCDPGAIYGLGLIGALFYFLQSATTFGAVLLGIGKAIFWPAFVIFKLLGILQI